MLVLASAVYSHELTPTYPTLEPSIYGGVYKTTLTIFNRREDVSYYQIEVYDSDWNPIKFATQSQIFKLEYLARRNFDVYIKEEDINRVTYICTRSKILEGGDTSVISSNICSKVK